VSGLHELYVCAAAGLPHSNAAATASTDFESMALKYKMLEEERSEDPIVG
jgi:hypothetical protein